MVQATGGDSGPGRELSVVLHHLGTKHAVDSILACLFCLLCRHVFMMWTCCCSPLHR